MDSAQVQPVAAAAQYSATTIVEAVDSIRSRHRGTSLDTLRTALHDALTAKSAEDAIVTAVNRGGDTDTIGAVTGAVAGARFGASNLPNHWLAEIEDEEDLRALATQLQEVHHDR